MSMTPSSLDEMMLDCHESFELDERNDSGLHLKMEPTFEIGVSFDLLHESSPLSSPSHGTELFYLFILTTTARDSIGRSGFENVVPLHATTRAGATRLLPEI
jgi:hypothetical protein